MQRSLDVPAAAVCGADGIADIDGLQFAEAGTDWARQAGARASFAGRQACGGCAGLLELATLEPAAHDNYQLLSTEQWLAAGNIGAAKQAFAAVSADARTKLATPRALVAAEIAYAENDGARAIHELDQIPVPTSADQAQNYWWIRGRSAFLTAHPAEGTRALVEREHWLTILPRCANRTNSTKGFARAERQSGRPR